MLTNKRIKEAESNVRVYIQDELLKKTKDNIAFKVYLKNAKDSLKAAKLMSNNNIHLWTIGSSYYAMFYMANVILLNYGYKVGDKIAHKITADVLIALIKPKLKKQLLSNYEEVKEEALKVAGIKSDTIIGSFDHERRKRSKIQYQTTMTEIKSKAITSLKREEEFLFEMEKIITN